MNKGIREQGREQGTREQGNKGQGNKGTREREQYYKYKVLIQGQERKR
jgi:hypothetical protein